MNDREKPHGPQPEPRLVPVESNETPVVLPRPRTLRAPDRRDACRMMAAGWWRDAVASHELGGADVARCLGTGRPTIFRFGTGERLLPLGDVVAAPPAVATRVLRLAQERVDGFGGDPPSGPRERLVVEAVTVCSDAAQVALLLERGGPVEALDTSALERLIDLVDGLLDRLGRIRRRLWQEKRRREGGGR